MGFPNRRRGPNIKHKNKTIKNKKHSVSTFSVLPKELVVEILARVAASSSNDFFSSKLSCKQFYEIADDNYIYRHMSLESFPVPPWYRQKQAIFFLRRCKESGNPEALFREGVVDYFGHHNELESGLECLRKAAKSGHLGASYTLGIILLCSDDSNLKQQGMQLLDYVKAHRRLGHCRRKLEEITRRMWLNKEHKLHAKTNCCPMQEKHRKKHGWPNLNIDDEEDMIGCNECSFNREVKLVCELL